MKDKSLRIGIDARLWNETGVGRYVRNLIRELNKIDRKNKYTLFVKSKNYEEVISEVSSINFKVVKSNIRWHTINEQVNFARLLYKEKLDLMHFSYFSVPYIYRKRFVITIHDLILHHFPTGQATTLPKVVFDLKLLGYKFILKTGAKRAEKVITVSNATKEEIMKHLNVEENKIAVIYEGFDKKISDNEGNSPINSPYFLYVGNAYPHKNLERLIEAFNNLCKNYKQPVKLILSGREDFFYRRLKASVKKNHFDDKIYFFPNVTDEQLSSLYKHAMALVIPSLMEGFGLPAVEAMANKCLVAASDIPSLREICSDEAVYFNPMKVSDIEEKLMLILKNEKEFEKNKELGLERVKMFSWEKMAKETLKIYENSISI